jgi:antirestriction protein ArdC
MKNMTKSKSKRKYNPKKSKEWNEKCEQAWFDTFAEAIQTNHLPWQKPWKPNGTGFDGIPSNLASKKEYRGGNTMRLMIEAMFRGWTDLRFATRKQLINAGLSIKGLKNGSGCIVKYAERKAYEEEQDDGTTEIKYRWIRKWYEVFNIEQCEDYEAPKPDPTVEVKPTHDMMKHFDDYIKNEGITFKTGGNRAFYRSSADLIQLPTHDSFITPIGEVMTAFHEAGHSTGHSSRLKRPLGNGFGSKAYAFEELIAELSSMLVVMRLGGEFVPDSVQEENANNAAYLQSWLKSCEDKDEALGMAFHEAQKAADYMIESIKKGEE